MKEWYYRLFHPSEVRFREQRPTGKETPLIFAEYKSRIIGDPETIACSRPRRLALRLYEAGIRDPRTFKNYKPDPELSTVWAPVSLGRMSLIHSHFNHLIATGGEERE